MAVDLKAATPDATIAAGAFLFGADSQAAAAPSVYAIANVIDYVHSAYNIFYSGGSIGVPGTSSTTVPIINISSSGFGTATGIGTVAGGRQVCLIDGGTELFRAGFGLLNALVPFNSSVLSNTSGGVGYTTGAGGTVTQTTSRTTGVTLNKICGAITLVSAAGSTTAATFTVTNSAVAATDVVLLSQKSGTDRYDMIVSAVAAGSFDITFRTYAGTTTEQPVFNFAVVKGVNA